MSLDRKSLARLRLLVAVARADGHLDDSEVALIREAFHEHPEDVDAALSATVLSIDEAEALREKHAGDPEALQAALATVIDVDTEVAALGDDEERRRVYEAAFPIAYADGRASRDEVNTLHRIFHDKGEDTLLQQVLGETRDTLLPSSILPVADPVQRQAEIREDTMKYSLLAGVLGAMPLPVVGIINDVAVIGLQIKLVRDIGQYWGHKVDRKAATSLLATTAGATGLRIAMNNIMRFVPGWGSAFAGVTSFATTYAVGKVAEAWFASGAKDFDPEAMKTLFEKAKAEGRTVFEERKDEVEALRAQHEEKISALNERLAAGEISREEYEDQLAELKS